MKVRVLAAIAVLSLTIVGCDSDPDTDIGERIDAFVPGGGHDGGAGGQGSGGGSGGQGTGGGSAGGTRRLSFVRDLQPNEGAAEVDLWIFDPTEGTEKNLTGDLDGQVDCTARACRLNSDMTWVAWVEQTGEVGARTLSLWIAPVSTAASVSDVSIEIGEKRKVTDKLLNFAFSGKLIFYSRGDASGVSSEVDIFSEPLAGAADDCDASPNWERCPIAVGTVNADGAFRVTDFSSLVILVTTTLSSMTVDFHNIKNTLQQTLYTFGDPGGTGSEFTGRLPLAMSPDATYLAIFTSDGFMWRVWNLEAVPNGPPPTSLELFEAQHSPAPASDCTRPMPFNFNRVQFDPRFSPDGEHIYFLAAGDCSQHRPDNPTNRNDFDILRVRKDLGGTVENVTNNPRVNHWSHHNIGEYALSPDAAQIAFTAARPNDSRSKSIWVIDTESGEYDCSQQAIINDPAAPDDRQRCEYLIGGGGGAIVDHRSLHWHNAATR